MIEEATQASTDQDWEKLAGKRKYQVACLHRVVKERRKKAWNVLIAPLALLALASGAGVFVFRFFVPMLLFTIYIFGTALYIIWHLKRQLKTLQSEIDETATWSET